MAEISVIDEDYLLVDLPGEVASGHVYLYFPTLPWRVWENHLFSVAGTLFRYRKKPAPSSSIAVMEKSTGTVTIDSETPPRSELWGLLRLQDLADRKINDDWERHHITHPNRLRDNLKPLLLLQPLRPHRRPLLPLPSIPSTSSSTTYMKILCIAAILPILKSFSGTKKLVWGVRNKGIVNVLEEDSGCLRG
jgi:hypothetical protein